MKGKEINSIYNFLLSKKRKIQFEMVVYFAAIITFILHIGIIALMRHGWITTHLYNHSGNVPDYMSAIYTPFTIILLAEVYQLIYYLPHSITTYLGKQYEIVALIIVRGLFDNLSRLPVGSDFAVKNLAEFALALVVFLAILVFIFIFYKLSDESNEQMKGQFYSSPQYYNYILIKRILSIVLLGLFFFLLFDGFIGIKDFPEPTFYDIIAVVKQLNITFFNSFFSALILTEVLLLLFMYKISDRFDKIVRNSGFILSTILLKLAFLTQGMMFMYICLVAIIFGVAVMGLYRLFEKRQN